MVAQGKGVRRQRAADRQQDARRRMAMTQMVAAHEVDAIAAVPRQLFVGGCWRPATGDATFDVVDPSTGAVLCAVADARPADGAAALDAAVTAQPAWGQSAPRERGEVLRRAFEALMDRREELALVMTLEMGKP